MRSSEAIEKRKLRRNRQISLYRMLVFMGRLYQTTLVRKLPKSIAYPLIRVSFFMATFLYHWIGRLIGRPTFKMYKERIKPPKFIRPNQNEKRLDRSLRAVVNAKRSTSGSVTEIARENLLRGAAN